MNFKLWGELWQQPNHWLGLPYLGWLLCVFVFLRLLGEVPGFPDPSGPQAPRDLDGEASAPMEDGKAGAEIQGEIHFPSLQRGLVVFFCFFFLSSGCVWFFYFVFYFELKPVLIPAERVWDSRRREGRTETGVWCSFRAMALALSFPHATPSKIHRTCTIPSCPLPPVSLSPFPPHFSWFLNII